MKISTIGLDTAKSVFQVHGVDEAGCVVLRRKLRRGELLSFFGGLEPCLVGLEACGGSHHWAREIGALGHDVRLVPPLYVKGYVKRGKNDAVDAEAICEAVSRPSMRFVPVKSRDQQAALSLHRLRDMLVRQRTMLVNLVRSQMAEFGIVAPKGRRRVADLAGVLDEADPARVPELLADVLCEALSHIDSLDRRIEQLDRRIVAMARLHPLARLLMTVPGIGPVTATAMVAAVDDPGRFRNGRHFAAWLGLVPRQDSTAGKARLGAISKMGDRYLRKLLVLGATASLRRAATTATPLGAWTRSLLERSKPRPVTIALANKTARIAWAVMATRQPYSPERAAA